MLPVSFLIVKFRSDPRKWVPLGFNRGELPALDGMALTEVSSGKVVLFGGHSMTQDASHLAANTIVYEIDFNTLSTKRLSALGPSGQPDYQSNVWSAAALGADGETVYNFGGRTISMTYSAELRKFNLRTGVWENLKTEFPPPPRASTTLTLIPSRNELLAFGGRSRFVKPSLLFRDDPHSGLCRGQTSNNLFHYNDVFIYDIENNSWRFQMTHGELPRERAGHSAVLLPSGRHLFIYGGYKYLEFPDYMNDAFVLDLDTWEWKALPLLLHPNSSGDPEISVIPLQQKLQSFQERVYANDTFDSSDEDESWSNDEYDRCAVDISLAGHSMHLRGQHAYLFGGETAVFTAERFKGQFSSRELYRLHLRA